MINQKKRKQGQVLLLLSNRSRLKKEEIAKNLEIHPSHLSKIFNSEVLTSKIRRKAASFFQVDEAVFDEAPSLDLLQYQSEAVNEPDIEYKSRRVEEMTVSEVIRYLEEKDRRHYEERGRLLAIIENLTKK